MVKHLKCRFNRELAYCVGGFGRAYLFARHYLVIRLFSLPRPAGRGYLRMWRQSAPVLPALDRLNYPAVGLSQRRRKKRIDSFAISSAR